MGGDRSEAISRIFQEATGALWVPGALEVPLSWGGPRKEAGHDCNLRSTGILGDTRKEARVKRSLGGTTGSSLGGRKRTAR